MKKFREMRRLLKRKFGRDAFRAFCKHAAARLKRDKRSSKPGPREDGRTFMRLHPATDEAPKPSKTRREKALEVDKVDKDVIKRALKRKRAKAKRAKAQRAQAPPHAQRSGSSTPADPPPHAQRSGSSTPADPPSTPRTPGYADPAWKWDAECDTPWTPQQPPSSPVFPGDGGDGA
jgi:hypothetical protein